MKPRSKYSTIFIVLFCVLVMAGCNDTQLQSSWRNREIIIDGSDAEWQDISVYFQKSKVVFGICNDEKYVYMCMVISDHQTEREIIGRGFTVWCDAKGGNEKVFGIHFPLGFQETKIQRNETGNDDEPGKREQIFQQMTSEMEILGPGKEERVRMTAPGTQGVRAQFAHSSNENLVYELRLPLKPNTDQPYAIGADTGKTIGIGFEVAEADREAMKKRMGEEGEPRGGRGGGGGGGGGRGGGRSRGKSSGSEGVSPDGGSSSHEALNIWMRVTLASMPAAGGK